MLLVDSSNKIKITAGDTGILKIKIPGYELKTGDKVYLTVSNSMVGSIGSSYGDAFQKVVNAFEDDGTATITIQPNDTKDMSGRHFYDIQVTRANGEIHTVVPRNVFEILEEVTKI